MVSSKTSTPSSFLDGADGRLHQQPQVARGVIGFRQEPGDLVMADLRIQQLGQTGRGELCANELIR
jgi:hypothetical protein